MGLVLKGLFPQDISPNPQNQVQGPRLDPRSMDACFHNGVVNKVLTPLRQAIMFRTMTMTSTAPSYLTGCTYPVR